MRIRPAESRDLDAVAQSYRDLLMFEMDHGGYSHWKFGVFPTMEIPHRAYSNRELYVAEAKGRIIGSMILTDHQPEVYSTISWPSRNSDLKVLVLNVLCIRPQFFGKGYGRSLVRYAVEQAREMQYDVIRCNYWEGNEPARKIFQQMGFSEYGTASYHPENLPEEIDSFVELNLHEKTSEL